MEKGLIEMETKRNIELGKKARKLIPGGAHTYSKGDDQFPYNAPRIIERGKGCYLWDVDGNRYTDFAMSLGSVILGHAYEPVLEAVRNEIKKGVNFCRPSIIEGELAEIVTEIIPSAEMVKFGKNGSDVTTAAIKLARAYTGREYIARCSADPFNSQHDWFIGSTVMTRGIPKCVQDLTKQFHYNDIQSCQKLFDEYPGKIAAFIFEPISMDEPKPNFLSELKQLCEKNGTVLIFDEVVSGFRFALGGVQEMVGVIPHLSCFGKSMANGFSVSALVGAKEIMKIGGIEHDSERVFLMSSTHGGETHSLAASIATIREIKKHDLIKYFWHTGGALQEGVKKVAKEIGAENYIKIVGYPCKPGFAFKDETGEISMVARTLFLQETIRKGLLIPYVVPSFAHKDEHTNSAIDAFGHALSVMKQAAENGGMKNAVEGDIVKPVFRRFN